MICNPHEIIILGKTLDGEIFRPSNWAEMLCSNLALFASNKLTYSYYVRPMKYENISSIAVDRKLHKINSKAYKEIMDFAHSNKLQILTCNELIDHQHNQPKK